MSIRVFFTQRLIFVNFLTFTTIFYMFYISLLREDIFGLFLFLQKLKSLCSIMQGVDINTYI